MNKSFLANFVQICLLIAAAVEGIAAQEPENKPLQDQWEYITYPRINLSRPQPISARFLFAYRKENSQQSFNLTLSTTGSSLPKETEIIVRLHRPNGEIVPLEAPRSGGAGRGAGGHSISDYYRFRFPWGKNALEEAWIEVRFPEQTYWLEIPYGFTRNPVDPLAPADSTRGVPMLAQAMKNLGPKDRIVPWLCVQYDLGEIQNNWRLSIKQANRYDGETELILYREDQRVGNSIYVWEMCSPQTSLRILRPDRRDLRSTCMSVRRHEDGYRRSDTFSIFGDLGDQRDWGRMMITVDDKTYALVMPSSLFRTTHGTADPHHDRRYRPEKE